MTLADVQTSQLVFAQIDKQVQEETQNDWLQQIDPMVATALGTGIMTWLVHAGQAAAELLKTAAVWVQVDPLTVLQGINQSGLPETTEKAV